MKFLVFEGLDGSGKSSLMAALEQELKHAQIAVHRTREPGGTPLGEELREIIVRRKVDYVPCAKTELLLYEAIRAQHVEEIIKPKLKQGVWILSDRFAASSVAFQAGGRTLAIEDVVKLNEFATSGLKPDLTFLLDLSVEESRQRRQQRVFAIGEKEDRIEAEADQFHDRVRQSFLAQAKADPERWQVLNAKLSTAEMLGQVMTQLRFKKWLP